MIDGWNLSWEESFLHLEPSEWNELVPLDNPFYRLEFLQILERSSSIGRDLAWRPYPLLLRDHGSLIGALVFFKRFDSYGEYIFDFEWASLYQRAGLRYYPKLTSAIPFTPVTSNKILKKNGYSEEKISEALIAESIREANRLDLSTVHILFHRTEESLYFKNNSYSSRLSHQFHWINREYEDFENFLASLKKDRRKSIRKERESLLQSGVHAEILEGDSIDPELWKVFYEFYKNTHSKKWGRAYLTRDFFQILFSEFRQYLVLLLARKSGNPVGGSLNFRGGNVLYGRYWGAVEEISFLHFECCYYGLIDYSIRNGISRLEAGAQGEHKYLRGFEVVPIHSSHYFVNPNLRKVFQPYLDEERSQVEIAIRDWNLQSPLKIFREENNASK